jgi:hypothetical protein
MGHWTPVLAYVASPYWIPVGAYVLLLPVISSGATCTCASLRKEFQSYVDSLWKLHV